MFFPLEKILTKYSSDSITIRLDLVVGAYENSDSGEVRPASTGRRHEKDVFLAAARDLSADKDPTGVGKQYHLQQDPGIVGGSLFLAISVAGVRDGKIRRLIDQAL
jgi:hypothetical protein